MRNLLSKLVSRAATLLIVIGMASVCVSCREEANPQLTVDPAEITDIPAAGDEYRIGITSNEEWVVSDIPQWCSFDTGSGNGDAEILLTVAANGNTDTREHTVRIESKNLQKTLLLRQEPSEPVLTLSPDNIENIPAAGAEYLISVTSDTDWMISDIPEWCTFSVTTGSGTEEVTIAVTANHVAEERTHTVKIESETIERTLVLRQEAAVYPELSEIVGAWEAEGYRWDLDNGRSVCYLMTEDGYDFELDEDGNYITVTIREYCEQYAEEWNADPANETKGTPEDFADHLYEGTYMFTNINVTDDEVIIYMGQRIPGAGGISVLCVTGSYTYDQDTGIMTVDDTAIEYDPRVLEINVFWDEEGRMNFRYSDYDIYTTPTYDKTREYYVYAPMIFYCRPGEAHQ